MYRFLPLLKCFFFIFKPTCGICFRKDPFTWSGVLTISYDLEFVPGRRVMETVITKFILLFQTGSVSYGTCPQADLSCPQAGLSCPKAGLSCLSAASCLRVVSD